MKNDENQLHYDSYSWSSSLRCELSLAKSLSSPHYLVHGSHDFHVDEDHLFLPACWNRHLRSPKKIKIWFTVTICCWMVCFKSFFCFSFSFCCPWLFFPGTPERKQSENSSRELSSAGKSSRKLQIPSQFHPLCSSLFSLVVSFIRSFFIHAHMGYSRWQDHFPSHNSHPFRTPKLATRWVFGFH